MVLAGHVGKTLRAVFSRQNLVTHATNTPSLPPRKMASLWVILSFRGGEAPGGKAKRKQQLCRRLLAGAAARNVRFSTKSN